MIIIGNVVDTRTAGKGKDEILKGQKQSKVSRSGTANKRMLQLISPMLTKLTKTFVLTFKS